MVTVNVPRAQLYQPVTVTCHANSPLMPLTYEFLQSGLRLQIGSSNHYRFSTVQFTDAGNNYMCVISHEGREVGRSAFALYVNRKQNRLR